MPSESDLDATMDVVTFAEQTEAFGTSIASRLEDAGFETVADLLIADVEDLEEVSYVGRQRAVEILALVDDVDKTAPTPREVDFDATTSVVTKLEIPRAVQRGERILVSTSDAVGHDARYHTAACRYTDLDTMSVRTWDYADFHNLDECQYCRADYDVCESTGTRGEQLVDAVDAVLEANMGEKLRITLADQDGWVTPRAVTETEEPVTWEAPMGDDFQTRRITIADMPTGETRTEDDLVVDGDSVYLDRDEGHQPDSPSWDVESVEVVGRVSQSTYFQLVGRSEGVGTDTPEGDDTYQKYQQGDRGETA